MRKQYDAIIVGGGHAGIEAALSVARAGHTALLVTMNIDTIGQMSCNPAIGGLGKGHMVREIDALGGEMALATDATGLQFKMLNRSKGPAVWAPRAQSDKKAYNLYMKQVTENTENLDMIQDTVERLIMDGDSCVGIISLYGQTIYAKTVVLTTGTFLKGLCHIGDIKFQAGRGGENSAMNLSDHLRDLGFEVRRFKTGTPPRLHRRSIDFSKMEPQLGDEPPPPFSFQTEKLLVDQLPCYMAHTNVNTHALIQDNLERSAMYGGHIEGSGPRYCPSIEDKVVRFAEKERHQVYLEPEGRNTDEIYVNGMSTSLPQDVQEGMIHSIVGLEKAVIMRLGYAVEYDYCPPTQLFPSLETRIVRNLFLAGQINGTTGYEEAAAQGLMAGLNVIRKLRDEEPFVLDRSEAYIGVLIDDLVTKGTNEPYRMFTSLAEFRLILRQDNADERLMKYGHAFGLIKDPVYEKAQKQMATLAEEIARLKKEFIGGASCDKIIRRPDGCYQNLPPENQREISLNVMERINIELKYEGYLKRQDVAVHQFKKLERRRIPTKIVYNNIRGMRHEAMEKLTKVRPETYGQATRIPGVSFGDLSILAVHIERMLKDPELAGTE